LFSIFFKNIESFEDKRQNIRITKQISVTRISNLLLNSTFLPIFAYVLEIRDFDWGGGNGGWGGGDKKNQQLYC
jgi:hypothetical protein